ncbi:MAG: hypothetical protein ACR2NP_22710, partial [Pirellulaceae bacterium]
DPFLASIRNSLVASVESAFGSSQSGSTSTGTSAVLKTNFGVGFDFNRPAGDVFRFSESDQSKLSTSLKTQSGASRFEALLFGKDQSPGLVASMQAIVEEAEQQLKSQFGPTGLFVDIPV